jgi:hypothetical protein
MARIGFRKAYFNQIDYETLKYKALESDNVPEFEKVVDEKFAPEFNNAELYANDVLCESDYTFKKGALTITIADDNDEFCATILGNTISENEVISNVEDVTKEFGYGHIIPKLVSGARKYKVEFFPRVKFTKISSDNKTRGESVEFSTSTVEGTVFPLEKAINGLKFGDWEKHQTFATYEEADAYLKGLLTPKA